MQAWYFDFGNCIVFGNWKTGEKYKFFKGRISKSERRALSKRIKANKKAQEKALQKQYVQSAEIALKIWNECTDAMTVDDANNPIINSSHPYILKKGIIPYSARVYGDFLVIPVWLDGHITSIQKIDKNGEKRFQYGGKINGCFCPLGRLIDVLYICEGYATGCSILEHTGQAVVVAFNAGNLQEVSVYLRKKFPDTKIIIAADNDAETERKIGINPGIKSAKEAAAIIGADYIYPEFNAGFDGTDFNDYLSQGGTM